MAGPGHGEKRSRKMAEFILAIVGCPSIAAAARQVGLSERTAYRWWADADFQAEYRRTLDDLNRHAFDMLKGGRVRAVEALLANLTAKRAGDRTRAAAVFLTNALNTEIAKLCADVEALKEKAGLYDDWKPPRPQR
jgi:hypothetical protein